VRSRSVTGGAGHQARSTVVPGLAAKDSTGTGTFGWRPRQPGPDRDAAHTIAFHPEQGWSLLCDGVIVFDDMGEILPDGLVVPAHHPARARLPLAA
jgi:hypothetical protein